MSIRIYDVQKDQKRILQIWCKHNQDREDIEIDKLTFIDELDKKAEVTYVNLNDKTEKLEAFITLRSNGYIFEFYSDIPRKGWGGPLMKRAKETYKTLILHVDKDNKAAISCYHTMGFMDDGQNDSKTKYQMRWDSDIDLNRNGKRG
jgi:hypothetical protein